MPVSSYVSSTDSKTSPVCHLGKRFDRLMCQLVAFDGVDEEMGLNCVQQTYSLSIHPTNLSYRLLYKVCLMTGIHTNSGTDEKLG